MGREEHRPLPWVTRARRVPEICVQSDRSHKFRSGLLVVSGEGSGPRHRGRTREVGPLSPAEPRVVSRLHPTNSAPRLPQTSPLDSLRPVRQPPSTTVLNPRRTTAPVDLPRTRQLTEFHPTSPTPSTEEPSGNAPISHLTVSTECRRQGPTRPSHCFPPALLCVHPSVST